MTHTHCHGIAQSSLTALKIPCASLLPQSLEPTGLFTGCTVSPFPGCRVLGIIQYTDFSDWLLSRSNLHFRSLHVFSWLDCSLVLSAECPIVWVDHHFLFIHLLRTSWLLSSFASCENIVCRVLCGHGVQFPWVNTEEGDC